MIVMDIDGVVADARHRLHLIRRQPKDWDQFYARVVDDPVLKAGEFLYHTLIDKDEIVFLSGRRESTREHTVMWLRRAGMGHYLVPPYTGGHLILRKDDDYRPAMVYKLDQLRRLERETDNKIKLVIDDSPRTCLALSAAGYSVLQPWWAHEHDDIDAGTAGALVGHFYGDALKRLADS